MVVVALTLSCADIRSYAHATSHKRTGGRYGFAETAGIGWFPDANDPDAERYWDGTQWHGRRMFYLFNNPPTETPKPGASGMSTAVWVMVMVGSVVLAIVVVCLLAREAMGQ